MRRTGSAALLVLSALAACTAAPVPDRPGPPTTATSRPAATRAPEPSPTARATATPAGLVTAAPGALARLRVPKGPATRLAGTVQIDARYGLRAGGGTIVSNIGGTIVSNNGGSIVSNNGGSVVSNNGAKVLAFGGAAVIGQNGGNVIGQNGGNVVGQNGGNVVGQNGGNLVGDLGAAAAAAIRAPGVGVIGDAGAAAQPARWRLAQSPEAEPAIGEVLPAAGMVVRAFSMRTGALVPLGEDEAGKPVYEVLSDGAGAFAVHLPPSDDLNVLLTAHVPGREDPRLRYALVAPLALPDQRVDEDTRVVTAVIRQATIEWVHQNFNRLVAKIQGLEGTPVDTPGLEAFDDRLIAASRVSGAWAYDEARRLGLAVRIADALLARVDLPAVTIPRTGASALAEATTIFAAARGAVARAMAAEAAQGRDPAVAFQERGYVRALYNGRPAPAPLATPTEVVALVALKTGIRAATREAFLGTFTGADFQVSPDRADDMSMAILAIAQATLTSVVADPGQLDAMVRVIEAGLPADP